MLDINEKSSATIGEVWKSQLLIMLLNSSWEVLGDCNETYCGFLKSQWELVQLLHKLFFNPFMFLLQPAACRQNLAAEFLNSVF